ncbi:hypothetical protein GYMLUDRAFT_41136 [Collybiopsis luxurians FD-317 M1]|uniref:Uncharacterized protein n=1 Tax=Collybiopsis luxurians FD-317 M1 TaxID=944289 RepID=A0A0D0BHL2_9AGAR|nr:hypothetical protein GYMLUDRAFT_41136 [Collybiopsis luxurians FD-317 M1]
MNSESTVPPHNLESDRGLLLVYSHNGTEFSDVEFNNWYDEEHIPQRLRFPGCNNASRYQAIDSKYPPWAALYHTTSSDIPESEEWFKLREVASDTERAILARLPIMTRSTFTLSSFHRPPESEPTAGLGTGAGKVICIVHLQVTAVEALEQTDLETSFIRWYQDFIIKGVSKTPGWIRSRVYNRHDGRDMKTTPELKVAMDSGMLVIHEWNENGDAMDVSKQESNVSAQVQIWEKDRRCKVTRETRIMTLYKEW